MFCEKCGRENPTESRFCEYCGAKLAGDYYRSAKNRHDSPLATNPAYDSDYYAVPQVRRRGKLTLKIAALIAAPLIVIAVVITLYMLSTDAHKIRGEWDLISGNMYDSTAAFPAQISFSNGKDVTASTYSGKYDITEEEDGNGSLEIDAGIYDDVYEYSLNYGVRDDDMLVIRESGSQQGTGDVGIYVNLENVDDDMRDSYYYATDAYTDMDLYDYLEGHWSSSDDSYDSGVAFALTDSDEKIDGHDISYTLGVPEHDDDELFDVDGNLITIGGLNAFRVIPISADSAYFYCYADDVLVQLDRMDE